jgi:hypothetical protein
LAGSSWITWILRRRQTIYIWIKKDIFFYLIIRSLFIFSTNSLIEFNRRQTNVVSRSLARMTIYTVDAAGDFDVIPNVLNLWKWLLELASVWILGFTCRPYELIFDHSLCVPSNVVCFLCRFQVSTLFHLLVKPCYLRIHLCIKLEHIFFILLVGSNYLIRALSSISLKMSSCQSTGKLNL